MNNSIFNIEQTDLLNQPMFFGEGLNLQRFDEQKYPIFEKLFERQLSYFWRPEEINLTKDAHQYKHVLTEKQKHVFLANLSYQILMDSSNSRAPSIAFLPFVSIPELEQNFLIWSLMELIHSRSYTHIIKNLESNPDKIFSEIMKNEKILARAKAVTKYYDDFIEYSTYYRALGVGEHSITSNGNTKHISINMKDLYRKLYMAFVSVYLLEGLRFYVSFICSFSFARQKPALMVGVTNIISMIARDEFQHTGIATNIIRLYQTKENNKIMLEVMKEQEQEVIDLFKLTVAQEEEWADYLFGGEDSSILLGINADILKQYAKYICNVRSKVIGIPAIFTEVKDNPVNWADKFFGTENKERSVASPQDTEIINYQLGKLAVGNFEILDFPEL